MGVLDNKQKMTSVLIAKERLRVLLLSDRSDCTPDTLELLKNDLYHTISKYITVEKKDFCIRMNQKEIHINLTGEKL